MKISIVIPVYNAERYLGRCLDSVVVASKHLAGTDEVEVICVDDGSVDGSAAILDEYHTLLVSACALNVNYKVLHQENQGVSVARNAALDIATGDYVAFLDADDFWANDFSHVVVGALKDYMPDLLRINFTKFQDGENPVQTAGGAASVIAGSDVIDWSVNTLTSGGYCGTSIIKRTIIGEVRFPVGVKYAEDSLFLLRIAKRLKKVAQLGYAGYFYRDTPGSAIKRRFCGAERLVFFNEFHNVYDLYRIRHPRFAWMCWFHLVNYLSRGDGCKSEEIRLVFMTLARGGCIAYLLLPVWVWPAYFSYCSFGDSSVAKLTYGSIGLLCYVKKIIKACHLMI